MTPSETSSEKNFLLPTETVIVAQAAFYIKKWFPH
jgi:hypothetical protein